MNHAKGRGAHRRGAPAAATRRRASCSRRRFASTLLLLLAGRARADAPAVIERLRPSVLPVGSYRVLDSPRFGFRGSGFVVGDGRLLVTNAHVVPEAGAGEAAPPLQLAALVPRADGGRDLRLASLERLDRAHDLALLRLEGAPLPALELAPPGSVKEGEELLLAGFPIGGVLGYSMVTHRAMLSSITKIALPSLNAHQLSERAAKQLREGPFEVYQLDATAYPGNSGGPLVAAHDGKVVGVVNMVLVRGTRESALSNPTGITYAIPARFVRELLAPP
ncbi:MAG: trypsin-like peptidase domain-containing protein [Rubrivivax sp.]|nr:trypsin-like peptidase domain-containing protein [Rubrivivax sp.]